jgi:hypothetical protein
MAPALSDGELVRLEWPGLLLPGDVAAFSCPTQDRLLVHRFLGYVRHRGAWKIMAMADRGSRPDPLVDRAHLIGRVRLRGGLVFRVSPTRRLEAMGRFVAWCFRFLCRRIVGRTARGR